MEDRDREMLIRVEQQLVNATQNQSQILEDLREIFKRLEQDSKVVTTVSGDLKAHLESSNIRWSNMEKLLTELERKILALDRKVDKNSDDITSEREERNQAITNEREARSKEDKERETFETEFKASFKTISWIVGALSSIAIIVSAIAVFLPK